MQNAKLPALVGSKKGVDNVSRYDSLLEFVNHADSLPVSDRASSRGGAWDNGQSFNKAIEYGRTGDKSLVAASDDFMSKMENMVDMQSSKHTIVRSIAGGSVNVGAYLAGSPQCMRIRKRTKSQSAPLTIAVEITSSGGIDASHLIKRGNAVLALARLLSLSRPISLWITAASQPSCSGRSASSAIAVRLDSAPLDLGRAAHVLCAPAFSRSCMYAAIGWQDTRNADAFLAWPYDDVDAYRKVGVAYWQRIIGTDELLWLAPPYYNDKSITDPVGFVKEMLEKYGQ